MMTIALISILVENFGGERRTYSTMFQRTENSIFEQGRWTNGKKDALDWCDIKTTKGHAFGTETGRVKFDDSTALLTGNWGPDQTVEATVFSKNQSQKLFEEVEIRLRSSLAPHRCTGYEINFRCLKTGEAYTQIVRWNGKLGDFTYLDAKGGVEYGVKDGDIVKATIAGNLITAYINGKQILQARDDTYKTGQPGMGFYLEGDAKFNADFGFTKFSVKD